MLRLSGCVYSLSRGDLEAVTKRSGFRRAGERRPVVGKDPQAGVNGEETRRCSSSDLWSIPQCRIRRHGAGSH